MIHPHPSDRITFHTILQAIKAEDRLLWAFRILLPCLLVLSLSVYPIPLRLAALLTQTREATLQKEDAHAAADIRALAEYFPWRGDLWEAAGIDYLSAGQPADAVDCLLTAQTLNRLSTRGATALGDAYEQQGKLDLAVAAWKQAVTLGGSQAQSEARILHATLVNGTDAAALAVYAGWEGWTSDSADDLYTLGVRLAIDLNGQATGLLAKAGKLDAGLQSKVNNVESGIFAAKESDPAAYRLLLIGRALTSDDEWSLAELAFQKACQQLPDYAEAWAYLGLAKDKLGQDGNPELQKALSLDPQSMLIQALEAIYWTDHGKPDIAIVYLHAIAASDPKNALWQMELGYALEQMNDLAEALPYYQNTVTLEPKNAAYWRNLASFSLKYGIQIKDIGLAAANQAVILEPQNTQGLDLLGQLFLAEGDGASAARMEQKALSINANFAAGHYHLGLAYLQESETSAAYAELQSALKLAQGSDAELAQSIKRTLTQYFP